MDLTEMELTTILEEQFGPDGYNIRFNVGDAGRQRSILLPDAKKILEEKFRPDGYTIGF
ncbi:MAG: hypothetical protein WC362_07495 [Methanoregula sp.]|jgi:uncharacterized protein YggU (UPF0235/DUF167 family)